MYDYEVVKWQIKSINTMAIKELTEWEENFMESVTEQFNKDKILSDKQVAIIERIYKEKT